MRAATIALVAIILISVAISCGKNNPASNPGVPDLAQQANSPTQGRVFWGIWDIAIDPASSTAEAIPLRGASFQANVTRFLQPPSAPVQLLTVHIVDGTNFAAGKVNCNITIKHPFPGTKFCGFDVMGIVMDDWPAQPLTSDSAITCSRPPSTLLQNSDGWTRWWNQVEFTTYGKIFGYTEGAMASKTFDSTHTLNAFKYFSDDLAPEDVFNPDPSRRGFFSSSDPGINTRRYELQFYGAGGVMFHFKYAISANWEAPLDTAQPPFTADEYPPKANMPEAYLVNVIDNGSTAYYQSPSIFGGDLNVMVEVRDWQFTGDLSSVSNEVAGIRVESPTLFPSPVDLDLNKAEAVPGNSTAFRVPLSVIGVTPSSAEDQILIVTVLCAHPTTYEPQIPGITGFDFPNGALAAYGILQAPISAIGPQNVAPVADASASTPLLGDAPLDVSLDPSKSFDPDGTLVLYEWDFESDGIYDASTPDASIVHHSYDSGSYNVTLRVTDNGGASDTDTITVNAGCFSTPGWFTFRHDNMRTGRSSVDGPLTNNVKYKWNVLDPGDGAIMSGLVIDSKSRALFRANTGFIYCVNPDGSLAWSYNVGGVWDYSTPNIGNDGLVYVGNTSGQLYCFDSEGNYQWMKQYNYGSIDGGIALQDDGSMLFTGSSGYLVKVDSSGGEIWNYSTGYTMPDGPSVDKDGTIYVANHGGAVYAIDQDGGLVWKTQVGPSEMSSTPALGPNGLFIGNWGGNVFCLRYDGSIKWTTPLSGYSISSFAAVGCNGKIYIGSRDDNLYCLDQETGHIDWQYQTCGDIGTMSPLIDGEGRVYVGSYCGFFYCFSADGSLIWQYDTGIGGVTAMYCKSPAITDDGTVVVGSNAGILFAFKDG